MQGIEFGGEGCRAYCTAEEEEERCSPNAGLQVRWRRKRNSSWAKNCGGSKQSINKVDETRRSGQVCGRAGVVGKSLGSRVY